MIKIATVCTGIGSPEQALKELAVPHEVIFGCEIDKYAKQTYLANFSPERMLEDMTKENWSDPKLYSDLFIGGIPCQSFSLAGKRMGELDPRGLLFYNFYDYVKQQQPKVFIIENVKGLLSDNKGKTFQMWLDLLGQSVNTHYNMFNHEDSLLYNLHYTVLNSKDFGVPQNRERVFIVGIRGDLPNDFRFPVAEHLTIRLKDILEPIVDEKFYLSDKMLNYLFTRKDNFNNGKINYKEGDDVASCINASSKSLDISDNIIVEQNSRSRIVNEGDEISPSILANQAKQSTDSVYIKEATEKGFAIAEEGDSINISNPNSATRRGRVGKGIANTLETQSNQVVVEPLCVAMRGRNPDNPSDRTTGANLEQTLEINSQGITNTISTVQKDNLIVEPLIIGYTRDEKGVVVKRHLKDEAGTIHTSSRSGGNTDQFVQTPELIKIDTLYENDSDAGRIYSSDGISSTIKAEGGGLGAKTGLYNYRNRIRRLTPLECFRLQGFPDSFVKPCSDTQLYKQAGNSITVHVIKAIIKNLLPTLNE